MAAHDNGGTGAREMFLRTVAIIGLLAVLILGAWGIIVLATSLPSIFERAGSGITSIFVSNDDEENTEEETPIEEPSEEEIDEEPETPVVTTPKPSAPSKPVTYVPAATPATSLYGQADLRARIVSLRESGDRMNATFIIENIGTNAAHYGWQFEAEFPWQDDTYSYSSTGQQPLYPGDHIVYTLGFDAFDEDDCDDRGSRRHNDDDCEEWEENWEDGKFEVFADFRNVVRENNESNNRASERL